MSKYTTQVRFICENKSGLEESVGCDKVDEVLAKSWDKIFSSHVRFFDEEYRCVLCQKILKHYYLREIGCETVGVWVLWMNTRLEEIMPYYNQLYESELIKFNPMHDTDLHVDHNRTVDGTTEETGNTTENSKNDRELSGNRSKENNTDSTDKRTGNVNSNGTERDLFSDTPQGALTGVESETYLTNAKKITTENDMNSTDNGEGNVKENGTEEYGETENRTGDVTGTSKNNGKSNTIEDYIENVVGKRGSESFSSLLLKFRETFLNIDMQVIEEFDDLFMGLW